MVVDKFSKYAHFVALSHPFTALKVAMLYMDNIFKLHGLPQVIVSDRDRIFTSNLWQELFKLSDTELRMSTAYHPQTDGQTERVNQCLEAYLCCFVHGCPSKWKDWLSLAEFWYNTTYDSSLNKTPFEVLYGQEHIQLDIDRVESCAVDDLKEWLSHRKTMTQLLQQQLMRAQQRQKHQADKNRSERSFSIGDSVYLKLQPYIQQSVMPQSNYKLSFRYFGPFTILAKVGEVAYKLQLLASSAIHPVFHVSQLKRAVSPTSQVCSTLPPSSTEFRIPQAILQRRHITRGDKIISQILVHWSSWPSSLSTCEDEEELLRQFPAAPAWGSRGGGDVTDAGPVSPAGNRLARLCKPNTRFVGPEWQSN